MLVILLVLFFAIAALLAARVGIRSIQTARTMVFYRKRQSYMRYGRQWLTVALMALIASGASALFGKPIANQILPPSPTPSTTSTATALPTITPLPTRTATSTPDATLTPSPTSTVTA
ncbi:MAG TPA: hypothetical protein PLA27_07390, partial [Anaerolineales bacterium]|nr:hypothetical protein [Anaerolineales bacterium]